MNHWPAEGLGSALGSRVGQAWGSLQRSRRPRDRTTCSSSQQRLHQQRIRDERLRPIDQRVQPLVEPGRMHPKRLTDRRLLRARVTPILRLEREHLAIAISELEHVSNHGGRRRHRAILGAMTLQPPPDPTPSTPGIPAGWYPDASTGQTRWWDGHRWGAAAPPPSPPVPVRPTNGYGVAGFIVGLAAFLVGLIPFIGIPLGLIGGGLSVAGLTVGRRGGAGGGLALAGTILALFAVSTGVGNLIILALAASSS